MGRYFFNIVERDGLTTPDEEGMECGEDATAIEYAHEFARDLAGDFVKEGEIINGQRIEVIKDGRLIATVYLRHQIRITPSH
jgi:uncharacterized protein DUF6894